MGEGNTLSYDLEGRGREIAQAIGSDWFEIGTREPGGSATARPTAFGYSWLISRREGGAAVSSADELCGIFQRLEKQGCRILLVDIPPGAEAGTVQSELPSGP